MVFECTKTDGLAVFTKGQIAEMFEALDRLPKDEADNLMTVTRHLNFRFGLSDEAALEVLASWLKTTGLGHLDGRVDEAADTLAIG